MTRVEHYAGRRLYVERTEYRRVWLPFTRASWCWTVVGPLGATGWTRTKRRAWRNARQAARRLEAP